ncbi:MAG TPA: hypothetical protein VJP45_00370 [Candidatus Limnocylindria bacterium]|nr:hypothetical protein [Candidatus Limnocylindria bacterium]
MGMSSRVGCVASVPMMASTSARAASAQTSPVRAPVPVAAGEPVGLAPVPAGDDVGDDAPVGDAPVGEDVAVAEVAVGDTAAVPVAVVGVGDAPPVDDGAHAVANRTAKSVIEAINEVLMRYT